MLSPGSWQEHPDLDIAGTHGRGAELLDSLCPSTWCGVARAMDQGVSFDLSFVSPPFLSPDMSCTVSSGSTRPVICQQSLDLKG